MTSNIEIVNLRRELAQIHSSYSSKKVKIWTSRDALFLAFDETGFVCFDFETWARIVETAREEIEKGEQ